MTHRGPFGAPRIVRWIDTASRFLVRLEVTEPNDGAASPFWESWDVRSGASKRKGAASGENGESPKTRNPSIANIYESGLVWERE